MTSGARCVMMVGALSMPVWSASSWAMQPLEVSANIVDVIRLSLYLLTCCLNYGIQVELHITMLTLVLVLGLSTWMMLLVLQVLASYWSALADQF